MDEIKQSAGDALLRAMNEANFKPTTLARELKTSSQNVNNWTKRGVPAKYAWEAARLLKCKVEEISAVKLFGSAEGLLTLDSGLASVPVHDLDDNLIRHTVIDCDALNLPATVPLIMYRAKKLCCLPALGEYCAVLVDTSRVPRSGEMCAIHLAGAPGVALYYYYIVGHTEGEAIVELRGVIDSVPTIRFCDKDENELIGTVIIRYQTNI